MMLAANTLLAILAMATATVFTRLSGLVLIRHVELGERWKTAIDAIPPAVLMAVIAPSALATGWAETVACLVTALGARRLPLLASVALGVATVAALRGIGL